MLMDLETEKRGSSLVVVLYFFFFTNIKKKMYVAFFVHPLTSNGGEIRYFSKIVGSPVYRYTQVKQYRNKSCKKSLYIPVDYALQKWLVFFFCIIQRLPCVNKATLWSVLLLTF